ncbi:Serine dehydrogenase proteinase [Limimonas halophila]|uniref:Serine dehydrogenase proteinase n=1 Tax=Limimonas halophila TaxID=1082479 RepID=A0A1G7STP3_9PROT|nr:ATP-dependent Clp protease proteolytic subunit [Limimonas halophila]SDG25809.1 Serine dehydrogenase proteinase [Limimonas halophila]
MIESSSLEEYDQILEDLDADAIIYSGPILRSGADQLIAEVLSLSTSRSRLFLFLTTDGGDADAAFHISRHIRRYYRSFSIFIFGLCKSAGTLVTLGADEIVMTDFGELGPLDVQTTKPDELLQVHSGLDIFEGLTAVSRHAFYTFEHTLLNIVQKSGGHISAVTAAQIARELTADLYAPITRQIDPVRVGEQHRATRIAEHYGLRLNSNNMRLNAIEDLISAYPSHSSVIDIDEAEYLFYNVRYPEHEEILLAQGWADSVRCPRSDATVINVSLKAKEAVRQREDDEAGQPEHGDGEARAPSDGSGGQDDFASGTSEPQEFDERQHEGPPSDSRRKGNESADETNEGQNHHA